MTDELLTVKQVAELRGVSTTAVHNWIYAEAGYKIDAALYGRTWLISKDTALAYTPRTKGRPRKTDEQKQFENTVNAWIDTGAKRPRKK